MNSRKLLVYALFSVCVAALLLMLFLQFRKEHNVSSQPSEKSIADTQKSDTGEELKCVELTDELYEKNWPEKKQLIWINDIANNFDKNIIVELNNRLVEKGYGFVIRYMEDDTYSSEYIDKLCNMKKNKEQLDLFNMGGTYEGETGNRYKDCVDYGLAMGLSSFLKSKSGEILWKTFDEQVWKSLEIDGEIYSYDWRILPYDCLNAYIKKEYADKYGVTSKTSVTELFSILKDIPQDYCIINTTTNNVSYYDTGLEQLIRESGVELINAEEINDDYIKKAFLFLGSEDYIEASEDKFCALNEAYDAVKIQITAPIENSLTNNLLGIASWTENYEDVCEFIKLVNTDSEIANLLQYGIKGRDYELDNSGKVNPLSSELFGLGDWTISNRRISSPQGLEPADKESFYEKKIESWANSRKKQ